MSVHPSLGVTENFSIRLFHDIFTIVIYTAQPIGRMAAVGFRSEDEKGYLNNQLGTVGCWTGVDHPENEG